MPSWNIHIAHAEALMSAHAPEGLGIADPNAFLFGSCVPDIYVGFMVPDAIMRIDYRITHRAAGHLVPVPDADTYWDGYMVKRRVSTEAGLSLLLGTWAHLATDACYNARFRVHCKEHEAVIDDGLRRRKQSDFDLFGRLMGISSHIEVNDALIEAAWGFPPYRILEEDVRRAIAVADAIVDASGQVDETEGYKELDAEWLQDTFDTCDRQLAQWLETWQRFEANGQHPDSAQIREEAGLPRT
ncbi:MAG: zinc dependent phospholipase C family protein [Eggerthellaceae bacterium]|nr:zinc dependent phospholipase C family protein [Eggerthellaceae bacterium]